MCEPYAERLRDAMSPQVNTRSQRWYVRRRIQH